MPTIYKRKNEIGFIDGVGRHRLKKHIEENYIKLDKGYYSTKELFAYLFKKIFGDRAST